MTDLFNGIPVEAWHGGKGYSTRKDCYKTVQVNKRGFGAYHLCLSAYERAVKNREIATKETVVDLILCGHHCISLLRGIAQGMGMMNSSKVRSHRVTKKLEKRKYLSPESAEWINDFLKLMEELERSYAKKKYAYGNWITEETAKSLEGSLETLKGILNGIKIVNPKNR